METTCKASQDPHSLLRTTSFRVPLYSYVKTGFTTRRENTPETLTSSVRQLWANPNTWSRHAQKGRPVRRPEGRRRSGSAHTARPECAARWAWHSAQECFQIVKRDRRKEGGEEEKEGGREEKEEELEQRGLCASLWETLLVLIYTSMTTAHEWAHSERRATTTKSKKHKKQKLWRKWLKTGPLVVHMLHGRVSSTTSADQWC